MQVTEKRVFDDIEPNNPLRQVRDLVAKKLQRAIIAFTPGFREINSPIPTVVSVMVDHDFIKNSLLQVVNNELWSISAQGRNGERQPHLGLLSDYKLFVAVSAPRLISKREIGRARPGDKVGTTGLVIAADGRGKGMVLDPVAAENPYALTVNVEMRVSHPKVTEQVTRLELDVKAR